MRVKKIIYDVKKKKEVEIEEDFTPEPEPTPTHSINLEQLAKDIEMIKQALKKAGLL